MYMYFYKYNRKGRNCPQDHSCVSDGESFSSPQETLLPSISADPFSPLTCTNHTKISLSFHPLTNVSSWDCQQANQVLHSGEVNRSVFWWILACHRGFPRSLWDKTSRENCKKKRGGDSWVGEFRMLFDIKGLVVPPQGTNIWSCASEGTCGPDRKPWFCYSRRKLLVRVQTRSRIVDRWL